MRSLRGVGSIAVLGLMIAAVTAFMPPGTPERPTVIVAEPSCAPVAMAVAARVPDSVVLVVARISQRADSTIAGALPVAEAIPIALHVTAALPAERELGVLLVASRSRAFHRQPLRPDTLLSSPTRSSATSAALHRFPLLT
jgi:hypothetical protein